jgi:hypothetical protein
MHSLDKDLVMDQSQIPGQICSTTRLTLRRAARRFTHPVACVVFHAKNRPNRWEKVGGVPPWDMMILCIGYPRSRVVFSSSSQLFYEDMRSGVLVESRWAINVYPLMVMLQPQETTSTAQRCLQVKACSCSTWPSRHRPLANLGG